MARSSRCIGDRIWPANQSVLGDDAAGDARPRVARRLARVVVRIEVNDDRATDDAGGPVRHGEVHFLHVRVATPLASALRLGMSPTWCALDAGFPCCVPAGLKCPPALMPSPELQSPFSCT